MNLTLFRGDKIFNDKTQPGLYRGNGLTSKAFFGNGDPGYIDKQGFEETIRIHVNPLSIKDRQVYDISAYLSFSTMKDRAVYWGSDKTMNLSEVHEDYTETRYIFTATIPKAELIHLADAFYEVKYNCNRFLKKSNGPDPGFITASLQSNVCPHCVNGYQRHSLILIDTVSFLEKHKHLVNYDGAYKNACEDNEWLLLPNDPMGPSGKFQSARIQRADFWSAKHYRLTTEAPRDLYKYGELGQIFDETSNIVLP